MNNTIEEIIEILKKSVPELENINITENMQFGGLEGLDSMSIVNFRIELADKIGEKAYDIPLLFEMTIADYVELLNS